MYKEQFMPSANVLTCAFLMNLPQSTKNTDSVMNVVRDMTDEEFKVWKDYQMNGTFLK